MACLISVLKSRNKEEMREKKGKKEGMRDRGKEEGRKKERAWQIKIL